MEEKPVEECKIMDAEPLRGNVNRFPLPAPAPIPETYFEKHRLIEDMFCHEKLEVYQKSVEFLKEVISVIRLLPNGNSDIVNQLRRAASSISLNIAEGAGKTGVADKKRYYSIARGSTLECAAIFDLLKAWNLVDQSVLKTPTSLLSSLAAMLSKLVFKG